VLAYVLTINAVAVLTSVATGFVRPVTSTDVIRFAVLVGCAAAYIELTRQVERHREYLRGTSVAYIDTKSVWSFAAVLVLPPVLATAMVILTYAIAWLRIWPHERPVPAYRWVFSCATVLIATNAAVAVLTFGIHHFPAVPIATSWSGLLALGVIVVAGALRWLINAGLVMAAIAISTPPARVGDLFDNFSDQILEVGAMSLGLVSAVLLLLDPLALVVVLLAIIALHRGVLIRQYRMAATVDSKTGLASAGWWHTLAEKALARAKANGATLGVLILDLDWFKRVNDTYGHLVGDQVLHAVGQALAEECRVRDTCGRWGGEEFVVLVGEIGATRNLTDIAERLRRRILALTVDVDGGHTIADLTVSIGGATYQPGGTITTMDELLLAADTQLYRAKNAGRNQTSIAVAARET
ncbi:MAG TPA: diguanylate cyclase, partial [Pseudonocardiaceae bacterium]|nr:diguanylate cyclase [Pseudonocardiaceae bacterium]